MSGSSTAVGPTTDMWIGEADIADMKAQAAAPADESDEDCGCDPWARWHRCPQWNGLLRSR